MMFDEVDICLTSPYSLTTPVMIASTLSAVASFLISSSDGFVGFDDARHRDAARDLAGRQDIDAAGRQQQGHEDVPDPFRGHTFPRQVRKGHDRDGLNGSEIHVLRVVYVVRTGRACQHRQKHDERRASAPKGFLDILVTSFNILPYCLFSCQLQSSKHHAQRGENGLRSRSEGDVFGRGKLVSRIEESVRVHLPSKRGRQRVTFPLIRRRDHLRRGEIERESACERRRPGQGIALRPARDGARSVIIGGPLML